VPSDTLEGKRTYLIRIAPYQQPADTLAFCGGRDDGDHIALAPCRSRKIEKGGLAAEIAVLRTAIGFQSEAFKVPKVIEQKTAYFA